MSTTATTAPPAATRDLTPERTACPHRGRRTTADSADARVVHTPAGVTRPVRRCHGPACKRPYRPEAEGAVASPRHEFGLDVVSLGDLQPDIGREAFWVVRYCLSGETLLAKSLLSARSATRSACPTP